MEKTKNFYQFSAPLLCPNGLFMWKLGETKRRQLSEWVSRLGLLAVSIWIESEICNSKVHKVFLWNIFCIGNIVEKTKQGFINSLHHSCVLMGFLCKKLEKLKCLQPREREWAGLTCCQPTFGLSLKFMEFRILLNPVPTRLCHVIYYYSDKKYPFIELKKTWFIKIGLLDWNFLAD